MNIKSLVNAHDVAELLGINAKMIYTLISEKELPATKITGKRLFQRHLVEQWLENETVNYPRHDHLSLYDESLIILGSNEP